MRNMEPPAFATAEVVPAPWLLRLANETSQHFTNKETLPHGGAFLVLSL
jgi:hypothetical protein